MWTLQLRNEYTVHCDRVDPTMLHEPRWPLSGDAGVEMALWTGYESMRRECSALKFLPCTFEYESGIDC